nr:E3 ubiquitin-protein ligase RNF135 isoform X3 [Marmota flaviventris]
MSTYFLALHSIPLVYIKTQSLWFTLFSAGSQVPFYRTSQAQLCSFKGDSTGKHHRSRPEADGPGGTAGGHCQETPEADTSLRIWTRQRSKHCEHSRLSWALSSGEDRGLTSLNLETSNTSEGRMGEILHDLEEIQKNLQENFTWKAAPEEQTQVEFPKALSSSSLPDQSCPQPRRTSRFAQWIINPTFDLGSLSCILKVSEDCRTVTVSQFRQPYPWSQERFSTSQVLCSQALSSGRHYWEVDTKCCNNWAVGVASWGMSRDRMLGRTADSWCIEWKGTGQLSAWTMVKETVLGSDRPGVVGIWLDLEERKLAFYSVASQEKLLYECEMAASSPLHPAFWLYGLTPGNSLIINQVRV